MEVHHHSHSEGKKNWKSYIREFMMIFLAVFCGFLAEYQLEHVVERERAKELSKSFYQELLNDSITAGIKVQNRIRQENSLKYLISFFRDSSLENVSKTFVINFEYGINFRSPSLFEARTIMLEQLRNSGSMRYFKNEELQVLMGDLTVAIKNINDRQELESQNRMQYINPIIIQNYDFDFDNRVKLKGNNVFEAVEIYEKSNDIIPFHLQDTESIDRKRMIQILSYYKGSIINSTRQLHLKRYIDTNAALLKVLRKEYHLN